MKTATEILTEKGITYFDMNNKGVFDMVLSAMDEHANQFKSNKLFEFVYCGMTEESSYATISLHRTREGAEKAMNEHKQKERLQHDKFIERYKNELKLQGIEEKDMGMYLDSFQFGRFKDWHVQEVEILD